jgi:hypothetical protein
MLTLCTGHPSLLPRREWLVTGGASLLGGRLLAGLAHGEGRESNSRTKPLRGAAGSGFGRAKSVLLVYTSGGQSQLEMWDPKPLAPLQIRGEFGAIASAVPGTFLGEHLPRVAQLTDRFCIVRSMSHDDLDHGSASYLTLTGQFHPIKSSNPPPRSTDQPVQGAVLNRLRPPSEFPYNAIHLNGPVLVPETPAPGQDGGFLGRDFEPLVIGDVTDPELTLPCLETRGDLPLQRLRHRQTLKQTLDRVARDVEHLGDPQPRRLADSDLLYRQAFEMLDRAQVRGAFDLEREPAALRERYGRHRSGQACLLARRLIEAGVPLVTVMWNHSIRGQDKSPGETDAYGWDTHNDIFEALKVHLLPRFDQSFSALLEDLDDRGLLDETLVICLGEFGRAPLVAEERNFAGNAPGRKHWASVYSLVVAGAGVTAGSIYGASDKTAAQPVAGRATPADLTATIFWALGIDPAGHYRDLVDRPWPISTGQPLLGLWG